LLVWGRLPKSLKDPRVRALGAYKDFLILWKDADADITILKQAKAEYAKLP
jgi:eukaryotic-like serine/threonine-protein kinase